MSISPISTTQDGDAAAPRAWLAIDPLMILAALGLVGCSLLTLNGTVGSSYADRQAIYAALGLIGGVLVASFDYSRLRDYRYVFYGLLIVLNLIVFGMPAVNGARRWIPLPLLQFQPSEFGKLLLIVALAGIAVGRGRQLHERGTTTRLMLLALLAAMIVIPQPDIGTGLVYVTIAVAILFFAGTSWKQLTALAALFVTAIVLVMAVAPAVGVHVLKTYQEQRLTAFLHPSNDPQNQTQYQLNQSLIAVGSGGDTGRGAAGATQAKLQFLPEAQDDFVFAVLGESYGFVGAALVLSLYALLIWRILRVLTMAKNLFGTLIAGGVLAMLMFQVFVNVGMTIGIMPVTGVPLPLMSYGGSSVLVTLIAIGLLQSIHIQARVSSAGKARLLLS
ncbi:MAG: rod shape-determining protein RodA [Solirubrobacteraceae bacterium]